MWRYRVPALPTDLRCGVWGVGCGVWGVGCGKWGVGSGFRQQPRAQVPFVRIPERAYTLERLHGMRSPVTRVSVVCTVPHMGGGVPYGCRASGGGVVCVRVIMLCVGAGDSLSSVCYQDKHARQRYSKCILAWTNARAYACVNISCKIHACVDAHAGVHASMTRARDAACPQSMPTPRFHKTFAQPSTGIFRVETPK